MNKNIFRIIFLKVELQIVNNIITNSNLKIVKTIFKLYLCKELRNISVYKEFK